MKVQYITNEDETLRIEVWTGIKGDDDFAIRIQATGIDTTLVLDDEPYAPSHFTRTISGKVAPK